MRMSSLLLAALSSLVAAGCGRPDETSGGTWTGSVVGSDAVVGAVVSGNRAAVYVCGGDSSFATVTRWFQGTREELSTGLLRDGWVVDAAAGGDSLAGKLVAPDGGTFVFSLAAAAEGSAAGLYSTVDAGCRTGVVVHGEASSMQGVWCSDLGEVAQVTPGFAPDFDGGLAVAVERPEGLLELLVQPFLPAVP